jgi:hypothetical protein
VTELRRELGRWDLRRSANQVIGGAVRHAGERRRSRAAGAHLIVAA